MFYLATLGFIKTSVLCFYTRLGDRYLTRLSWVMMAVIGAQATSFVLVAAFQCQTISKAWTQTGPGKCVDINLFYLCNAALNIVTDVLTYTLPIKVIFNLQVPQKQKFVLGVILCLGLLYVPTSCSDGTISNTLSVQCMRLFNHSNHLHPLHALWK